jgi:hypothetical protein
LNVHTPKVAEYRWTSTTGRITSSARIGCERSATSIGGAAATPANATSVRPSAAPR